MFRVTQAWPLLPCDGNATSIVLSRQAGSHADAGAAPMNAKARGGGQRSERRQCAPASVSKPSEWSHVPFPCPRTSSDGMLRSRADDKAREGVPRNSSLIFERRA